MEGTGLESQERSIEADKQQLKYTASEYCIMPRVLHMYIISTVGAKAMFFRYHSSEDRLSGILPKDDVISKTEGTEYLDPDTPRGAAH